MITGLGEDNAKEVLLDIGYFRLDFCWNPFKVDSNHYLIKGILFSNDLDLYYIV